MRRLSAELQRLYLPQPGRLTASASRLCCLAIPAQYWAGVAELLRALQENLDLPAPAISVDGQGFRLWLAFQEAIDETVAQSFITALRQRYLPDWPAERLRFLGGDADFPPAAIDAEGERWTAYIDPGMGSLFIPEPALDFAPPEDKQADLLSGLTGISPPAFAQALSRLQTETATPGATSPNIEQFPARTGKAIGSFANPKSFLLAVMNDPQIALDQRIDAAKALLPYVG